MAGVTHWPARLADAPPCLGGAVPGCVVIGAGPAGLTAAHELAKAGRDLPRPRERRRGRGPLAHEPLPRLRLRHRRAPLLHQGPLRPRALGGDPGRGVPAPPEALADLLSRPLLRLPAQAGERAARPRSAGGAAHRSQLAPGPAAPAPRGAHLRAVGLEPLRTPALRDLLQDLHREGLGHPVPGDQRRLGPPAHQEPRSGGGAEERVPRLRAAGQRDHQPDRGVPLPAPRTGSDVGGLRRTPRRARHEDRARGAGDGHPSRGGARRRAPGARRRTRSTRSRPST